MVKKYYMETARTAKPTSYNDYWQTEVGIVD